MEQSRTAIIVLNWNGWAHTIRCLESIYRLDAAAIALYVCDNASSDGSPEIIAEWSARQVPELNDARLARGLDTTPFTFLPTGANLGYAGGNNVGLRHALADGCANFWVLNNDCEVAPDALTHLRARLEADPAIGLCGATLVHTTDPARIQAMAGAAFDRLKGRGIALGADASLDTPVDAAAVEAKLAYINGAAVLVTRAFLETVGLMSEDYFLYWEELDWARRAGKRFRLGYAPAAIVRHAVGASIGTGHFGEGSALSIYYLARNRLHFCRRHSRLSLPFVYVDTARQVLQHLATGNIERAGLLFRAVFNLPFDQTDSSLARRGSWPAHPSRNCESSSTN